MGSTLWSHFLSDSAGLFYIKVALDKLANLCGLNNEEVAVFGDDYNDLEILSGFKYSIAMGNACDEVKSCAGYVTLDNNEEGICFALSEILRII